VGTDALSKTTSEPSVRAQDDSGYTYDWQSGNSYNWNTDSSGDTNVRGYNLNSGSMWNQTVESDGDQHGYDGQGNYWNYDAQTKTYNNFGTGKYCVNGLCN
jgi:hypothetical protein